MTTVDLLQKTSLFEGLPLSALNIISESSSSLSIPKGELLFIEGDNGSFFYLLINGSVRLFKSAGKDRETTIRTIQPGEIFAEVILFENSRYPVSAEATSDSLLMTFERKVFSHLLDDLNFRNNFCSILMKKQRYLAERIKILSALDVEERFLLFLVDRYGYNKTYTVNLSKKEIALEIDTVPETFSRMIKRLDTRNVIKWQGNTITIDTAYLDEVLTEIRVD